MDIYLNGRSCNAKGQYIDGKVIVLKGSTINREFKIYRHGRRVEKIRNDKNYVDGVTVIKDIEFSTPSAAAQFVLGYSVNGKEAWKYEKGISLGKKVEGE